MRKMICFFLIITFIIIPLGCKKVDKEQDKEVVILVENNKIPIMDDVNGMIDKYKEKNAEININIVTKDNIKETLKNKEIEPDLLITSRGSFIEIFRENEILAIDEIIREEKYNERFSNINSSSGRLQDKYYGIGMFPYTIDFLYNDKALEKLNIKMPGNSVELLNLLKLIKNKNIKIPYILPNDINIDLALSSYIANSLLISSKLKDVYGESKVEYEKIQSMEQMFSTMKFIVDSGYINTDSFYEGSEQDIQKLEDGDIPILMGTSLLSKDIRNVNSLKTLSNINLTENTIFSPVGIGAMISIYSEGKNKDSSRKLFGYLVKEDSYEDISSKGIITGDKNLDMNLEGVRGEMAKNIINANENNLFYFYNLPKEYVLKLKVKLKEVMNGKYSGDSWKQVVQ